MSQAEAAIMPAELPPAAQWTTNITASSLTTVEVGNSCLDEQIERLKRCEYLEVKALCLRAREILVDESNVQRVDAPVTVRMVQGRFAWNDIHSDRVLKMIEYMFSFSHI